ncbi:hypothetical protein ACN4EG_09820 [Alkalinema pantanalense CENA528]|uniref:hypothetical protein n=1 Tax=Alkalinema pantanalense TaxID=1620705 RepID=UPI003D6DD9C7
MNKPLNLEQSRAIAQKTGRKGKSPFDTAYQAALEIGEEVLYVQGFLVFPGTPFQPIEHCWLELADCLVDPNIHQLKQKAEDLYYFSAQSLTLKELKAAIEEAQEDYPEDDPLPIYGEMPYEYYGDVMLGGKAYQTAYEAAKAKSQELNRPKKKSED